MPNLFGRPLSSFLPFGSLAYHMNGPPGVEHGTKKHFWLYLVHIAYAATAPILLVIYLLNANDTGSLNPFEQHRIHTQRINEH